MHFPHKTTHAFCDQHPEGFYNQAKQRGVDDKDIPREYWPERLREKQDETQDENYCPF
jgi:hypothetical protein